jgi:hypothetical protein
VSESPIQEAFDKLNGRRMTLIARKHTPGGKLSEAERKELDVLNERVTAVVNALWPYPTIEEMAERAGLPVPDKHVDERQLEMLYACAPPDCAWCGEAHEGGPECCACAEKDAPKDNEGEPEGAAKLEDCERPPDTYCPYDGRKCAEMGLGRRTRPP